jgi:benzoate transport
MRIIMMEPRLYIDNGRMSTLQIIVIFITVLLNAVDGFDVLSISFAAPGIAEEWNTTPAALGIVLSMELIGMAIGSIFLGNVADRYGRRSTLLGCLIAMTAGMLMVPTVSNMMQLSIWRIIVGLGIGGILACINAVVAEFSNNKRRGMCISIMVIGYPLGGTFGGMVASYLLQNHDWRIIFYFGAILTGTLIFAVYFFVPESIAWLSRKQPKNALAKINMTLTRMKFPTVKELRPLETQQAHRSAAGIFSSSWIRVTLILTLAYFLHITTFYFILKWTPKLVVDMGFSPSLAGQALVSVSIGGAIGAAVFGWLTNWIELKKLTIFILVLTAAFVTFFGSTPADLNKIKLYAGLAGFFGNAGISGLYSMLAVSFPTDMRATGTGFVIGTGRAGAVLAPITAGFLLQAGVTLQLVALIMGSGALLAGLSLCFLKLQQQQYPIS